jgi:hypothetical protein
MRFSPSEVRPYFITASADSYAYPFAQKRSRNAKPISLPWHGFTFQKAANANWHRFLQRHQVQSEVKLLVTGHRSRHDMATGIGAISDAAVANIPTASGFIPKSSAQVPQEEPFGVENVH